MMGEIDDGRVTATDNYLRSQPFYKRTLARGKAACAQILLHHEGVFRIPCFLVQSQPQWQRLAGIVPEGFMALSKTPECY
jgi:hypothetical protein